MPSLALTPRGHLLFNPVTATYLGADGYSDVLQSANAALKDYSDMAWHLEQRPGVRATVNLVPVLLDQIEATAGGFYAVPPVAGTALKVGDHGFSLCGQPDREREPTDSDIQSALAVASARLAGFKRYRVLGARTCFYSIAEGERFVVELIERAWVLAGFSGHGFKFVPVVGEILADLATTGSTEHQIALFDPRRFHVS